MIAGHVWGESRARDRIAAQVAGLAPSMLRGRYFMIIQAFADESESESSSSGGNKYYALAGHIASVEKWAAFSADWEALLRTHGTLSSDDAYHFKMDEMRKSDERMRRVPAFFRVIEKYVLGSFSCDLRIADFHAAHQRIWCPQGLPSLPNKVTPYYMAFATIVNGLRQADLPELSGGKVDFYFDDITEKGKILEGWDRYKAQSADIRAFLGATPRFEDDKEFLPLQSGDFWAWWVRLAAEQGWIVRLIDDLDFGMFRAKRRSWLRIHFSMTIDTMAYLYLNIHRSAFPNLPIYDTGDHYPLDPSGGLLTPGWPPDRES